MISGGRAGVVNSTSKGPIEHGAARTVERIHKLEQYLVKFFDEDGVAHIDVMVRVGDEYYANPQGEEWCSRLGPAQSWLSQQVHSRILAKEKGLDPSTIPDRDPVNVTGSGMAKRIVDATKSTVKAGEER